jgi:hypothetical protein
MTIRMPTLPSLPAIPPSLRGKVLPLAIAAAGISAVCSGVYFYVEGQALLSRARSQTAAATQAAQQAAAASAKAQAIQAAASQIPTQAAPNAPMTKINDQVRQRMMAPARSAPQAIESEEFEEEVELTPVTPQITSMSIRVPIDKAKIRSGPGLDYPVIAFARNDQRYVITAWSDRWFKIKAQTTAAAVAGTRAEGWIRNDLVQLLNQ